MGVVMRNESWLQLMVKVRDRDTRMFVNCSYGGVVVER